MTVEVSELPDDAEEIVSLRHEIGFFGWTY